MLSSHPNFTHNHLNLHCCQVTPWTPPWPSPPSSRPWRNLWDMRLGLLAGRRSSSSELDVRLVVARHLRHQKLPRMLEQHHSFRFFQDVHLLFSDLRRALGGWWVEADFWLLNIFKNLSSVQSISTFSSIGQLGNYVSSGLKFVKKVSISCPNDVKSWRKWVNISS